MGVAGGGEVGEGRGGGGGGGGGGKSLHQSSLRTTTQGFYLSGLRVGNFLQSCRQGTNCFSLSQSNISTVPRDLGL